jgi:hypothetical protein
MVVEAAQKQKEEDKKVTTEDDSSSDEDDHGQDESVKVTEDQAKVAEAAGLGEQVRDFCNNRI